MTTARPLAMRSAMHHSSAARSDRCLLRLCLPIDPLLSSRAGAGSAPLIELRHVSKSYAGADGETPVTVLDDINLEVRDGEMLALLGQSGSGKSTILRLMAGLTEPTQGAVLSHGAPLDGVNPRLAIVFQSFALYPWLTVQENVQVGLIQRRLDRAAGTGGDRPGARAHRPDRLRECVSEAVVRRHAPARRFCAGARRAAGSAVHGRAVQRTRRPHRGEPAHPGGRSVARLGARRPQEHLSGDPQHRRGGVHRHPHCHHLVASRSRPHGHCQPAALPARRQLAAVRGARRPGARGDHGAGSARRTGGSNRSARGGRRNRPGGQRRRACRKRRPRRSARG